MGESNFDAAFPLAAEVSAFLCFWEQKRLENSSLPKTWSSGDEELGSHLRRLVSQDAARTQMAETAAACSPICPPSA